MAKKKKTAAQLNREINDALSAYPTRKLADPSAQRVADEIEEAAYAVFERPGGEDLTYAEFHEEVRGLLRGSYLSSALNQHIDTLYRRIYGPLPK